MNAPDDRGHIPSTSAAIGRTVVVIAALAALGSPAHAQEWSRRDRGSERGWIGISIEISSDRRGRPEAALITDISVGSPAEAAGLRPGDRVVAINDLRRPDQLASLSDLLRLKAGDRVVIEIDRNGDRQRLRLRAAPRPDDFIPSRRIEVSLKADSLVETWVRSMDSLRGELATDEAMEGVRLRRVGGATDAPRAAAVTAEPQRGVRAPFEFFVFRGEAHDSLRHEMVEVNRLVAELQARIEARETELRERFDARDRRGIVDDPEVRRLRAELDRISSRSTELETAMAEAARATAGFAYELPEPRASLPEGRVTVSGEFRPLTPYLLGRNRVAGAEVMDLRPELAEYFDVSSGVLVVDVVPGTPAAIAGIVPGDVITRIDQVGIRSVEDLRFGVSVAGDSLPVTLIRQGTSRQVLLRK